MSLSAAHKELALQIEESHKYAAALLLANDELAYQNNERENRAAELLIANEELRYQNQEKENRAAELFIANKELAYQNQEKENRASELVIALKELAFQNDEKEKRAAELLIANEELRYLNQEKENRASELIIANEELAYQNLQKEKKATELLRANKELETFAFISSHDLQEPLRKIQAFSSRISTNEAHNLTEKGLYYFGRIENAALRMQTLLNDLLVYSRATEKNLSLEFVNLNAAVMEVLSSLDEDLKEHNVLLAVNVQRNVTVMPFQFRQLLYNLISNSIKFRDKNRQLQINISSRLANAREISERSLPTDMDFTHIIVSDTGIGFDSEFKQAIFDIFRRLNHAELYSGTGVGLTIVKKIAENHNGFIFAESEIGVGSTFDIFLPFLSQYAAIENQHD